MSECSYGHLIYGYNLGGADGWKIREADEYGDVEFDWYDEDDNDDLIEAAETRLLVAAGFEPDDEDCLDHATEIRERLGVEFIPYGHVDNSNYVLGTAQVETNGWGAEAVDLTALANDPKCAEWDTKLAAVLATLGITPKQAKPAWILCSSYG